ncbi:hypothetical protein [Pedobacter duraquae]|uniref:Uncharacterized protein n=1 Tax=Pedobacter duraquae TaxID=425511 RepID=A0A4R6IIV1_9SPHI|nr:hypothetical protein [Pedobacter duraquae]TDO21914.1 hypothetical protein CLV32_3022 [Pedobacter duraquae]
MSRAISNVRSVELKKVQALLGRKGLSRDERISFLWHWDNPKVEFVKDPDGNLRARKIERKQ